MKTYGGVKLYLHHSLLLHHVGYFLYEKETKIQIGKP
jgi:hypothetical protein